MPTCAEAIVSLLEGYGMDTVFGIPGVHTVEFYRALPGRGLRHVTPRHEQGAGLMAYGYALATRKPAALSVITGAGLTNAATAIAQAYSDSLPMMVIAAGNKLGEIGMGRGFLHELPAQHRLEAEIAGWSHLLLDPANLPEVMAQAFALFDSRRPRPVIIEVPRDLFARETGVAVKPWPRTPRPGPDPVALAEAATLLKTARSPFMIVGGGAIGAAPELVRLAERLGAVVATTIAGKGIVPASHPLSAGASLSFAATRRAIDEADVVLAIGTELAETDFWAPDHPLAPGGMVIRVDIEPGQLVRNLRPDLAVLSDSRLAAVALLDHLGSGKPAGGAARAASLRRELATSWGPETVARRRMLDAIREAVPAETFISVDSTQLAYTGSNYYPAESPGCWHFPNGYGTLGTGLPAAIGARLADPARPVMAIAGDGGLLFTVEELAAAVELKLPIPILVWNNESYKQIRDAMERAQVQPLGTELKQPDFTALARAFGADAARPDTLDALQAELKAAFGKDRPTLIEWRVA